MMQKTFRVMASVCLLFFFSSCSKFELIRDHFDGDKPAAKNDFLQVKENLVLYDMGVPVPMYYPFQVKKIYDAGGNKLKKVITIYRSIVDFTSGRDYYDTLTVHESANQTDFIRLTNDTAASLRFDSQGKIISARANRLMSASLENQDFTFLYSSGKLSEIKAHESGVTSSFVKIEYESSGKNIKSITYPDGDGAGYDKVEYSYDYTKKVTAQFVPDDEIGKNFWAFLKYLNIIDELKPENLLIGSYLKTTHHPGDQTRFYSNHRFDYEGRLVGFNLAEGISEYMTPSSPGTEWEITWK